MEARSRKRLSKNLLQMKKNAKISKSGEDRQATATRIVRNPSIEFIPNCVHGPTILFERNSIADSAGESKQFFSCSAYRDRKGCHFFHPNSEEITDPLLKKWKGVAKTWTDDKIEFVNACWKTRQDLLEKEVGKKRRFCQDCHTFVPTSDKKAHSSHSVKKNVSEEEFEKATKLLQPMNASKKEAQFHFSDRTLKILFDNIVTNDFDSVLCIGAPRVFEHLKSDLPKVNALLLDIDTRLASFFQPNAEWCWYNMCNHHFFDPAGRKTFKKFVKKAIHTLVILDPPFGGRAELIGDTLKKITGLCKNPSQSIKFMWIFPYFMETKIVNEFPDCKMSDFQVHYDNHDSFCQKGRKEGSPIRIFTDLELKKIDLSSLAQDGYKFCDLCDVWVANTNKHCFECEKCTAKNGGEYRHCKKCKRCNKVSWVHCNVCQRCALPNHPCDLFRKKQQEEIKAKQ